MEGSTTSATLNKDPKDQTSQESLLAANWPSLPIPADTQETKDSQDSPIQPAQKSPTPWKGQQREPDDFERDRVGKYAKYFKENEILPIPEIVEPSRWSFLTQKPKGLWGLTKRPSKSY